MAPLKLIEIINVLYVKLGFQLMVHFHLKLLLYEVLNLQVQEFIYQNQNLVKDFIQTNINTTVCTHISNAVAMKKISIGTRQSRGDLDTAAELLSRAQEIYTSMYKGLLFAGNSREREYPGKN